RQRVFVRIRTGAVAGAAGARGDLVSTRAPRWRLRRAGARVTRLPALALALVLFASSTHTARADAVSGTLTIVGSDTLSTLVLRWSEAFRQRNPAVRIQM